MRCLNAVYSLIYTPDIFITRCILAGYYHILTKFLNAQRRTALIFVTQGVGCASCMCDWGIKYILKFVGNYKFWNYDLWNFIYDPPLLVNVLWYWLIFDFPGHYIVFIVVIYKYECSTSAVTTRLVARLGWIMLPWRHWTPLWFTEAIYLQTIKHNNKIKHESGIQNKLVCPKYQ